MKYNDDRSKVLFIIGENVRKYRSNKGWSQEKLAEESDLHRTYIGAVERGERNITVTNLVKISESLDIELSDLYGKED